MLDGVNLAAISDGSENMPAAAPAVRMSDRGKQPARAWRRAMSRGLQAATPSDRGREGVQRHHPCLSRDSFITLARDVTHTEVGSSPPLAGSRKVI